MVQLDCHSLESSLYSLTNIYGVEQSAIESFFSSFDIDKHYEVHSPDDYGDRELRRVFEDKLRCKARPLERVYWFHLSRTLPGTTFEKGILPLGGALNSVWETMYQVFEGTEHLDKLESLHRNGISNFQYNQKSGDAIHGGPYAMLVRESAFKSKDIGNHDYLWLPEIMEDICNEYQEKYGTSIHEALRNKLVPTIVKFWSITKISDSCVESALFYCYCKHHSRKLTISANTCFDGDNMVVPNAQIIKIETPVNA